MKYSILDVCKSNIRGSKWRRVRNRHIAEEYYCQCCGREDHLEVHHLIPWNTGIDRYEKDNLVTMCRHCHFRFGHLSNWRDINPSLKCTLPYMYTHFVKKTRVLRNWDI